MTQTATKEDKQAYAKVAGALDNFSDAYTYVAKALSVADDKRISPLTNSGQIAKYLKVTAKAQKLYSYYRKITDVLDEHKRDGALLKLGVKISMDLAAKVLGTSLTTHPYYAYHKAQIDALADALNANRNSRDAVDAYRAAIAAANSTAFKSDLDRIQSRKIDMAGKYGEFKDLLGPANNVALELGSKEFLRKIIAQYGDDKLREAVDNLETFRTVWTGLAFDAMELQIMAGHELNVAQAAIDKVRDLLATLMGGSNTSRVGGYAAISNIEWEKYDQMVGQKTPQQAVMDPIKFAQGNSERAAAWAQALADMSDFVRSHDVIYSGMYDKQYDKLSDVIP